VTTWRVSVETATPSQADYPGLRGLVLIDKTTTRKRDGKQTREHRAYASSLAAGEKSAARLLELIRGHWGGVEIRNHWRRDACWREDHTRTRNVNALANLALLRSALLRLCAQHWPELSLPRVFETCQHSPSKALRALNSHR